MALGDHWPPPYPNYPYYQWPNYQDPPPLDKGVEALRWIRVTVECETPLSPEDIKGMLGRITILEGYISGLRAR